MKKFILTLILGLFSIVGFGQNFPRFFVEDGDTVGVVLSLEQAQSLDNNLDLLNLLEKLQLQCDSVNSQYLLIIDKLNEKVVILETKVNKLEEQVKTKESTIGSLNKKVFHLEDKLRLAEEQIVLKEEMNKVYRKEITRQKFRKWIGFIGTGVSSVAVVLLAVLLN